MLRHPWNLLSCGLLAALAVTALAVPAIGADPDGTLAIVNGIPGKKVDVCLNGKEIKSNLAFGGKVFKDVVGVGNKNLKFHEHDPRTCRGHQVGQETFYLDNGNDVTIVLTKNAPKVVRFYNNAPYFFGEIPPLGVPFAGSYVVWRNASEMPVNFRIRSWAPNPEVPTGPAADPIFGKGQWSWGTMPVDNVFQIRARQPEAAETLALARAFISASHRYEWIVVGTNPGNVRLVALDRVVSYSSP